MKVLLVGNYEGDHQESMQRFAALMARGLTEAGHQARIVKPPALLGRLHPSAGGFGKWLGYVDKFGSFPFILKSESRWADIVHICDQGNAFYTKYLRLTPHLVTCHDLLAVRSALGEIRENPTRWTGKQLQRLILNGLTEAQHVACVSDATRKDLSRLAGIAEPRVSRVYNSLNYPYSPMEKCEASERLRKLFLVPGQPFLLHVGGNQWYKNRLGLLRMFSMLRQLTPGRSFNLVLVGESWTAEMRRFILENGMSDTTLELTGVSNEDLRALYSSAAMMLFPSLQEGFGWPIVEAQACGCPVAVSRHPPMDEIAGNAAIYIDPESPKASAAIVNQALEKVAGMRDLSIANAARFRSGMIVNYLALYDRMRSEKDAQRSGKVSEALTPASICSTGTQ